MRNGGLSNSLVFCGLRGSGGMGWFVCLDNYWPLMFMVFYEKRGVELLSCLYVMYLCSEYLRVLMRIFGAVF